MGSNLTLWSDGFDAGLDEAAAKIDELLEESWQAEGIEPAPEASDAEFHRRAWLDLAGVAPPVSATREFLSDNDAHKRSRLIDRLLHSPRHANHMATRWNETLLPPDAQNQLQQRQNVQALHSWLQKQFRENIPYDHLVGRFLTAGGTGNNGPAIFYTSHSVQPEKIASATSRIFLGLQLQCAECHDHPFDRWTQKDFWQYAAFFSQLEQSDARGGQQSTIEDRPGREVQIPETEEVVMPRYPGVEEAPEKDPLNIRRRQLTIWLASRDNPYFARAAVNRAWEHLFGRGIVDPVDAMDLANEPSHPELLDFLAGYLVDLRFDLRRLYATLARTRAYGRTSAIDGNERPPSSSFAVMSVKTLSAEQFYDSLYLNVFCRDGAPSGGGDMQVAASREAFLSRMRAVGSSPRDYPHGVVQVLGMMNGPEVMTASSDAGLGLMAALDAPFFDDAQKLETLFLATLSRMPTDAETKQINELMSSADDSSKNLLLSDLCWTLLNTVECAVCP